MYKFKFLLDQSCQGWIARCNYRKAFTALLLIVSAAVAAPAFSQAPPAAPPPLPPPGTLVDLAIGKSAYQSSTIYGGVASLATDNNIDGNFYHGSVSLTDYEASPWWYVDLGAPHYITNIVIANRTDWGRDQLSHFIIYRWNARWVPITDESTVCNYCGTGPDSGSSLAYAWVASGPGVTINARGLGFDFTNNPFVTQYVLIQKVSPGYLQLAEVRIWGY